MMTDERASRPQTFEETVIKFRQWLKIEHSSFCAARLNYSRLVSASVQGMKTNNPVDLICIKFIPSVPYFFFLLHVFASHHHSTYCITTTLPVVEDVIIVLMD
jgi:hypothetical protein